MVELGEMQKYYMSEMNDISKEIGQKVEKVLDSYALLERARTNNKLLTVTIPTILSVLATVDIAIDVLKDIAKEIIKAA
jgi:cytochrome bd-type quinol oxidase subunit 1